MAAWYDATTISASDNDPVGTWADSSGNGRTLTQATAGLRPTYRTNIQNGRPVVRFDGVDDLIFYDPGSNWFSPTQMTYFVTLVRRGVKSDAGSFGAVADLQTTDTQVGGWVANYEGAGAAVDLQDYFGGAGQAIQVHPGNNSPFITSAVYDQNVTNGTVRYLNGTAGATSTVTNAVNVRNLTVGARRQGGANGNNHSQADFCEILIYNGVLSTANRRGVESYLGSKWGITVS